MSGRSPGRFCLVLHTHMPYVEGYGTWPFGEEWLWEAMATSYLPLLDVLDAVPGRATLSLTPVLCDQLEAPGVGERFLAFLRDVRAETHRRDVAAAEDPALARELERSAGLYAAAARRFEARGGDLVGAFAPHAAWTSAATHAVLPMLATTAGVRLQLETGIAAHRRRFGHWHGGLWLPECGYAPWLDDELEEAGVHAACVDLTDVLGYGAPAQLRPLRTGAGPLLVPIDRAIMDLVWHTSGYPSHGAYRNTRRYTEHRHTPWAVDGAPYDPARAARQVRADAEHFVAQVARRIEGGGLCVCALDTELLGHFWHEGVDWLAAVVEACDAAGVPFAGLDDALAEGLDSVPAPSGLPPTSWGEPRDLSTWSGPAAGELAWRARAAELRVLGGALAAPPGPRVLRELLALQASDWAFGVTRGTAGPYPRARADGHAAELERALANPDGMSPSSRNLAPSLDLSHP
ncbi:MAG TPA: 1,4-alpha-glucan branching protein domain-containing protein [Solirubrobacteraceae bacterium]|nr:1,4-alpha-glucan branching protein domain-containing protein [Solirubrobacteraceae bacterium]